MGGHDHVKFPEIPDFRIYKVNDVPVLKETQERLARLGLKDPWLRNEVWRYQVVEYPKSIFKTSLWTTFTRGFGYGAVLAVLATIVSKTFARKVEHHH